MRDVFVEAPPRLMIASLPLLTSYIASRRSRFMTIVDSSRIVNLRERELMSSGGQKRFRLPPPKPEWAENGPF